VNLLEVSKDQIKGIQIALRACKKEYPFINGFFFDKDNDKYEHVLFIILTIDFDLVSKHYNETIKNKTYLTSTSYYSTFGIPFDWGTYNSDEWNLKLEYWGNEKDKVQRLFSIGIRALPQKYSFEHNPSIEGYCQQGGPCIKEYLDSTYGEVFPV
jgi:hypothetical protein